MGCAIRNRKTPTSQCQIGEPEQDKKLSDVDQGAIARFMMKEQVLDDTQACAIRALASAWLIVHYSLIIYNGPSVSVRDIGGAIRFFVLAGVFIVLVCPSVDSDAATGVFATEPNPGRFT